MIHIKPKSKSESALETLFVKGVRLEGGRALKLQKLPGMPDRLVLWPGGIAHFVEMKQPTGRLAKHQKLAHKILSSLGFKVFVLWNEDQIKDYLACRSSGC